MLTKLKTWYALHKWLAIVTGLAVIMWLLTGLVITAPDLVGYAWPSNHYQPHQPDFRQVTLAPTQAITQLAPILGKTPTVRAITLFTIRDVLVYRLQVDDQAYLIDTATGQLFTVSEVMATQIAKAALGTAAPLLQVDFVTQHSAAYLYGPVPAYRFVFGDQRQSDVYVATTSDEVYVDDQISRWLTRLEGWHTLHIGDTLLPNREQLVTTLVWLASFVTLLAVLIGYYLALPRRGQGRQERLAAQMKSRHRWRQHLGRLKTWYWVHKWLSIFTGLALIMWLLTGMAMSWDRLFPVMHVAAPPNVTDAILSPAAAIARLDQANGGAAIIRTVTVRTILGRLAYEIATGEGTFHLVDAASGELFAITPALAEQIARTEFPGQANVVSVERIDANSRDYPFGPLPVYRVVFDDWRGSYAHVSIQPDPAWDAKTADVRRTDRWGRLRELLGAAHTFWVLKIVVNRAGFITGTLWAAAIITLLAALTGYYLALPRRWLIRRQVGRVINANNG